jgi:basic membrane protein A and related proteins
MTRLASISAVVLCSLLAAADAPSTPRKLRVAYVTPIVTAPTPRELFGQGLLGFHRAVKDFGIHGRVVAQGDATVWRTTITSVARQKFDLIFPGIILNERNFDLLVRLMAKYPRTSFVVDFPYELFPKDTKNVQGTNFKAEEGGYLAGYLAALMERQRPGRDVIGSVGGIKLANVDDFIAGYQAGARKANPHIRLLNGYSGSFGDPVKCRAVARRQFAKGSGVVFNVAGGCGIGTLQAAREKGAWAIGVDVDQSFYGPHVLTSAIKRGDVWVYNTIRELVRGKLETRRTVEWDLANGGVGLGKISSKVPKSFVREIERIRALIIAEKITVPDEIK